jgi:Ca2+-binding RTX toxin-like protein
LRGGRDDDQLRGQNGDDDLRGGGGNDSLSGCKGDDLLTGGRGSDQFNFNVNSTSAAGEDTITDFEDGTDFINLGNGGDFEDLDSNRDGKLNNQDDFVTKNGNVTVIDVGQAFGFPQPGPDPEVLTVVSSSNNALNEADFLFLA